jgi:hypothetical protein
MDLRTVHEDAQDWYKIHTRFGTVEVLLNPSAKDFGDLYRKLAAPYARYMGKHNGTLPPGVEDDISRQCVAKAVLRDWRDIVGDDGEPLPFSVENALEVMGRDIIGDQFLRGVMAAVADLHEVVATEVEETEKN